MSTLPPLQCKVTFRLQPDEDGDGRAEYESVWAVRLADGTSRIENVPFYSYDAACDDVVAVKEIDGELFFDRLVTASGNSVLRVQVFDEADIPEIRATLRSLGCDSERNGKLLAVHVPAEVSYRPIYELFSEGEAGDRWSFEEAVLCHDSPSQHDEA